MRNQDIVSVVRGIAAAELGNVQAAAELMAEIGAREIIPHDQTGALLPPDPALFLDTPNADVAPVDFLKSGLAARVQVALMNLPAATLLALLDPTNTPAELRGALAALGGDTLLDCYRRVRN